MNFILFYIGISFHPKILKFPLRRISSVNYRLRYVIDSKDMISKDMIVFFGVFKKDFLKTDTFA